LEGDAGPVDPARVQAVFLAAAEDWAGPPAAATPAVRATALPSKPGHHDA